MKRKTISICLSILLASTMFIGCSSANEAVGGADKNNTAQQNQSIPNSDKDNDNKSTENKDTDNKDKTQAGNTAVKDNIDVRSFAVKGNYKTKSASNDFGEDIQYLKGNGTAYQIIGTTGKGLFARVYKVKQDGIYEVFSTDIDDSDSNKLSSLDYLDKAGTKETLELKAPIKVGTKWDGKEIVEVGKDLKIDGVSYKGYYVKVWERKSDSQTKVSYYSEGYGCVKYTLMQDKSPVAYFNYTKIG